MDSRVFRLAVLKVQDWKRIRNTKPTARKTKMRCRQKDDAFGAGEDPDDASYCALGLIWIILNFTYFLFLM